MMVAVRTRPLNQKEKKFAHDNRMEERCVIF